MKKYPYKIFSEFIIYCFFLTFIFIMRRVGIKNASNFCGCLCSLIGPLIKTNKTVRNNLKHVYQDISEEKINTLQKEIWKNFGRYIGEFAFIDEKFIENNMSSIEIEIHENTQKIIDQKTPVIMFGAHIANWDIALFGVLKYFDNLAVIYRKINNRFIDQYVRGKRAIKDTRLICKGSYGVKDLVRSIKDHKNFVMLVDQKMNDGIEVPFLGQKAMTSKAISLLSVQYGYPIIPVQVIRRSNSSNFKLIFHDILILETTQDKEAQLYATTLKINNIIGEWVNSNPSQWFWMHQRWGKPHEMLKK